MVKQIENREDFQAALNSAEDKFVVVDSQPHGVGLVKWSSLSFIPSLKSITRWCSLVDVDDCQDAAADCEVKCMPTFQFYKKGQKVGEFSGANKEKLEATINESS